MKARQKSFAERYLQHAAIAEGCNCAESLLRIRERGERSAEPGLIDAVHALLRRLVRFVRAR